MFDLGVRGPHWTHGRRTHQPETGCHLRVHERQQLAQAMGRSPFDRPELLTRIPTMVPAFVTTGTADRRRAADARLESLFGTGSGGDPSDVHHS